MQLLTIAKLLLVSLSSLLNTPRKMHKSKLSQNFYTIGRNNEQQKLSSNLISSYEKLNDIVLMKCGNIVIIDIAILKATLPGGWTKLFDIPSGYLPLPDIKNVDMYYIGSMYVKNSDISKRIRVTNNVVYGYSDTSISGELYGMIVYVCG